MQDRVATNGFPRLRKNGTELRSIVRYFLEAWFLLRTNEAQNPKKDDSC